MKKLAYCLFTVSVASYVTAILFFGALAHVFGPQSETLMDIIRNHFFVNKELEIVVQNM